MRKWTFTKAPQVLAFSNVKGKDLTLLPGAAAWTRCSQKNASTRYRPEKGNAKSKVSPRSLIKTQLRKPENFSQRKK
jgi:hypothetical protein